MYNHLQTTQPPTTASPTPHACGAESADAFFRVTNTVPALTCSAPTSDADGPCFTTLNGSCITDGPGNYGNSERCAIQVLRNSVLSVSGNYEVESYFDYFTFGTSSARVDSASSLQGRVVLAGSTIRWQSDGSDTRDGWTLCATVSSAADYGFDRWCSSW